MTTQRSRLSSSEFVNKIIHDADTGESFVPLIGSGLSSPSGIIMGVEFTNYLAFTTYLVLEDPKNRPRTYGEGETNRWDLVQKGWPPFPSPDEVGRAKQWIRKQFESLCERLGLEINPEDKSAGADGTIKSVVPKRGAKQSRDLRSVLTNPRIPTILRSGSAEQIDDYSRRIIDILARDVAGGQYPASFAIDELVPDSTRSYHNRIIEMGIRALHDWRETLVFLSMVGIDANHPLRLVRTERDSSVIDAFNLFITRDKQPNLGHKLLSHLASPLRIQTILTTNFDTLTEDAYRALAMFLRVLPVSARGRLPEARTVASEDSLVKLHGEAQDTRADLSLDEEPSTEDKKTFAAYLTKGAGNLQSNKLDKSQQNLLKSKRLLIVGYSGYDYRCVQMIRHWLETRDDAKVYWICFTKNDVSHVQSLFGDAVYNGKIRITQSARPDLMLYELYQRLVLSLPPGGLTYEFSHIVPPRRLQDFDFSDSQVQNAIECGNETSSPLESARILLGNTGSVVDSRRLTRDAITTRVKEVIHDAANRRLNFYEPDGSYIQPDKRQDRFVRYGQWLPTYRDKQLKYEDKAKDAKQFGDLKARPILIDAAGGVVRASAIAFDELSTSGKKVFWIDTQDYMDADGLMRDFLRGIALRFGSFQSRHVTLHPLEIPIHEALSLANEGQNAGKGSVAKEMGEYIDEILVDYRADASSLVVIIYGRDGYGGCSGLVQSNWVKMNPAQSSESALLGTFEAMHCVIEALARANVQVIYFPLLSKRAKNKVLAIESINIATGTTEDHLFNEGMDDWKQTPEPSLAQQWTPDPHSVEGLACDDVRVPLFKSIVTEVLKPFFTYDSREAKELVPRFERLTKRNERRLMFLYSITLFRHSRHPNAMCSEATFPCPFRHNASAIDNDFVRSEESAAWLSELRNARVFFDKPGGSLWMHRDIRITLQRLLEQSPLGDPKDNERRYNHHFLELRSRLHFWIGDWYFKAFCSSGHLTPAIEAIHHRVMAAVYSRFARPKSENHGAEDAENICAYRVALFESSVLECCKTILVAWHWLHLWQACSFDASWVTESHRKTVKKQLTMTMDSLFENLRGRKLVAKERDRMELAISQLDQLLEALAESLTTEGGGGKCVSARTDPFTVMILPPPPIAKKQEEQKLDVQTPEVQQTHESKRSPSSGNVVPLKLCHHLEQIRAKDSQFKSHIQDAFVKVSTSMGADLFNKLVNVSKRNVLFKEREGNITEMSKAKALWKASSDTTLSSIHQMVWLLGESAYIVLRRAKLNFHATGMLDFDSWLLVSTACNLGIDLCKHLPPSLIHFETDSKIKLHTLYSVALANLGRAFEANRHLNEAQGILSKSGTTFRDRYAILNIRRAEVRLTECVWISFFLRSQLVKNGDSNPKYVTSKEIRDCLGVPKMLIADELGLSEWSSNTLWEALGSLTGGDNLVVPPRISECCRKAFEAGGHWEPRAKEMLLKLYGATLDEAVALLDQAEKQLCGHSQSNLWWSRLHTLRLRVYGLLGELGDSAAMSLSLRKFAPDIGIYTNFTSALRISRNDDFRKLRAIRYFLSANRWHFRFTKSTERTKDPLSTLLPDTMDKALVAFRQIWKKHEPSEGYESLLANDPSSPKPDWRGKLDEHRFETAICRLAFDYGLEHFKAKEAPS